VVEVLINETGTVDSARVVGAVGSTYDKILLQAASLWRYQPAMVNGTPVKFRKRIQVALVAGR
jgi:TonB family protein